jgi:hypothetical protein
LLLTIIDQVMGDEIETSLLVGLISDERDTSFIIKLSLTAWAGQVSLPLEESEFLDGCYKMIE